MLVQLAVTRAEEWQKGITWRGKINYRKNRNKREEKKRLMEMMGRWDGARGRSEVAAVNDAPYISFSSPWFLASFCVCMCALIHPTLLTQ